MFIKKTGVSSAKTGKEYFACRPRELYRIDRKFRRRSIKNKIINAMVVMALPVAAFAKSGEYSENSDRAVWLNALDRIAKPLLSNLARGELKKNMPVESSGNIDDRKTCTYLEALGRTMTGIAPWLELGKDGTPEGKLRGQYIEWALKAIANAVNPDSPDYMNFNKGSQPLVDAAFLAHGLLRSQTQIWNRLNKTTQTRIIKELKSSRAIKAYNNNWLLFSAMVEAALKELSGEWELDRVKHAIDSFEKWYMGDGWYGDGEMMRFDYYNSFVIHPMLFEILEICRKNNIETPIAYETEKIRYARYAEEQERLISPEGSYPAIGRSLAYRFGAFYALSDVAYRNLLPEKVTPAQVRCALTCLINRQINAPGTFNDNGWLRAGIAGYQPSVGETYISTGSLYLCSAVFIALGLPPADPFWSGPAVDWTNKKVWSGVDIECDKATGK